MNKIEQVEGIIKKIEGGYIEPTPEVFGFTGENIKTFMHSLGGISKNYLEVGMHQGATFLAAVQKNTHLNSYGIDNFCQFGYAKEIFDKNIKDHLEPDNKHNIFIEDCWEFDVSKIPNKIDMYFYDAGHSELDQEMAFTHYHTCWADEVVVVIDDFVIDSKVLPGTTRGLSKISDEWDIKYSRILYYGDSPPHSGPWWNGLGVYILGKKSASSPFITL